ncbi:HpcH/HpaI aldolase family protein [Aurantiacibacter luteus]|uniref:HpcH/HpaI aldolase/citrate lyase domain-containing protein n=1 Tax=Aurantiacibacter luteus TaxID=1581420 RepID=A0A0G9MYU8_9SPHN|nr:HpcH/HpaI aldolase/citrate lyase family protein [Aurantiacibacter luteus]KLE35957.1 hypothetical protein AAW00_06295 [Aurantiacibacter luteus]
MTFRPSRIAFKQALASERPLIGMWQALADPYTAEICAHCGFDWLLFDGEHSPNSLYSLLAQAQAVSAFPLEPIARVPARDPVAIKQYLDMGFHTILVPMVEDAAEAEELVRAMRYAPHGFRGVSSATARAAAFGRNVDYLHQANEMVTLIVQIESAKGLDNIETIAAVEGVDALFVGPADLSASLGYLGQPLHPEVGKAVAHAKSVIDAAGKPAGVFSVSPENARQRIAEGFKFVSVGTDIGFLMERASAVLEEVRGPA